MVFEFSRLIYSNCFGFFQMIWMKLIGISSSNANPQIAEINRISLQFLENADELQNVGRNSLKTCRTFFGADEVPNFSSESSSKRFFLIKAVNHFR